MSERIDIDVLRDAARLGMECPPLTVLALIEALEAGVALLVNLDDAIAGADADPETWDAPYRIEAPVFRETADRFRDAVRSFDFAESA